MRKVSVNGSKLLQITEKNNIYFVDGYPVRADISSIKGIYSVIFKNKVYTIEVESLDTKKSLLKINGKPVEVLLRTETDLTLERLGLSGNTEQKITDIKAPMPGKILEIFAGVGDTVEKGTPLLVLEAMKMENVIKSPGVGKVQEIKVKTGQNVEKNNVLVVF